MNTISSNEDLFVEKYRPSGLDGYIGNESLIAKCKQWIQEGDMPSILLYSTAGTGKTSLAKILANSLDSTILYLNCSDENSVDTVRDKIKGFASTMAFTRWKIIICDEFEFMTVNGQAALRNLMETFSANCRFILTCNYVEKVIEPIQSRCQIFNIVPPSKKDVAKHVSNILNIEGITYDLKDLVTIINSSYPDIRRILNTCQRQIIDKKLVLDAKSVIEANYMDQILEILKGSGDHKSKFTGIRQLVANSQVRDFTALYRYLFDHLDDFASGHIAPVILILADAQFQDAQVVDKELNVMSMMVKLLSELA